MKVIICGIIYKIEKVPVIDEDYEGIVQGKIMYAEGKILVKQGLPMLIEREVIIHEMIHGVLYHIGQSELCSNEEFVQSLANGIYNSSFDTFIIGKE